MAGEKSSLPMTFRRSSCLLFLLLIVVVPMVLVSANPMSKPYIPFRTSPTEQSNLLHHQIIFEDGSGTPKSRSIKRFDPTTSKEDDKCPLQFSLGISKRVHQHSLEGVGIIQPPIIFPILPSQGPGRQVVYVTQYEHLDMMTPSSSNLAENPFAKDIIKEALVQHVEFPMLFESSAFLTSPIIRDVNNDGILDVIVADYDGGIYAMGLQRGNDNKKRYFHKAQVPRLYVRRHWMESLVNETLGLSLVDSADDNDDMEPKDETSQQDQQEGTHDPYHSYFEYTYGSSHEHEPLVRGVTANVLGLDQKHVETLKERRNRKVSHNPDSKFEEEENGEGNFQDVFDEQQDLDSGNSRRRLQEIVEDAMEEENEEGKPQQDGDILPTEKDEGSDTSSEPMGEQSNNHEESIAKDEGEGTPSEPEQDQNIQRGVESDEQSQGEGAEMQNEQAFPEAAGEQYENAAISEKQDKMEEQLVEEMEHDGTSEKDEGMGGGGDAEGDDDEYSYRYGGDDMIDKPYGDDYVNPYGDDYSYRGRGDDDEYPRVRYDDDYPRYDDYYGRYNSERDEYYDEKHYIRITPHILCTPVLVEFPKLYNDNGEIENYLFVAVSYYMDEDEYDGLFSYHRFESVDNGDESEVKRGMYIANALMVYQYGEYPRWGRQEHLDLSGDHTAPVNTTLVGSIPIHHEKTSMGAFALSSPTVADIDGDGNMEVLVGTSMGFVYGFDARNLYKKDSWPVQFPHGIESRIIVEDVLGDTNLEIFVADVGGNVACLDHKANKLWHRNLISSVVSNNQDGSSELLASSQLILGDVDGDGVLDVVITAKIREPGKPHGHYMFAFAANTGKDLPNFPVHIWSVDKNAKTSDFEAEENKVHQKLPAPLLIDLHGSQDFLESYLKRNGTTWVKPSRSATISPPHGGNSNGLHIVQPIGSDLIVMEGGSGCIQAISIGDHIVSTVQADDVHGTNSLDLVLSTASGNLVTLDFPATPYHPLNVWNNGEMRGSTNTFAHGYSASQGIFIHYVSRQFRDIFGVYIPITFEIFDNRPNIKNEPDKRVYKVEIRSGMSKALFRKTYDSTGIYTERFYIPFGPGYYTLTIVMKSTHGLVYEDTYHLGYNVNYMGGFAILIWLPLVLASITIFAFGRRAGHWDDEDYQPTNGDRGQGILGRQVPE